MNAVADELLMIEHSIVPCDVEKGEQLAHGVFRMEHELLVIDKLARSAHVHAVLPHALYHSVPVDERLLVVLTVET